MISFYKYYIIYFFLFYWTSNNKTITKKIRVNTFLTILYIVYNRIFNPSKFLKDIGIKDLKDIVHVM